ncbi:biotin--[acetyl-CoA-carboxylase] ligase [Sporanaerobium hydrogeniformans]|uniref:Biotin--[acetyl-CoA-carboxylase] ligase n=1 Tax=Sporanaerobium hydrogeniformans TaxID=3072179 RepID=A0AC61DET2_9FIRM|nr:biotin--[acetyl-CoA-carboxylase] ligase [Sporanaerobium hydrogeniformans]PHV71211.1 biotin--[acetyl-CoA-carboxylase] ligase [Sporanaerobium hydrogeniformans]
MVNEVLTLLKNAEDYLSGEEMSKVLGVTRASIWKTINKLKEQGYTIESSTRKGYRIKEVPNIITKSEVLEELHTQLLGREIVYYEEISSTNEEAKQLAREGCQEGLVVIADQQLLGKGRLGRNWSSPAGTGIWMSLVLRPPILPLQASTLTLVAGLSLCEAIEAVTGLEARIKWPNDIVVNGKKVCGILTEMSAELEGIKYVILGIGINVNTPHFPEDLPYASSLYLEGKQQYIRKDILKEFLMRFEKDYFTYLEVPTFQNFIQRYEAKCITLNKKVKILASSQEYVAYAKAITEEGMLKVVTEQGEEKIILAGEVSVRGLYGYVDEEKEKGV